MCVIRWIALFYLSRQDHHHNNYHHYHHRHHHRKSVAVSDSRLALQGYRRCLSGYRSLCLTQQMHKDKVIYLFYRIFDKMTECVEPILPNCNKTTKREIQSTGEVMDYVCHK